jgi:hypothetical protein
MRREGRKRGGHGCAPDREQEQRGRRTVDGRVRGKDSTAEWTGTPGYPLGGGGECWAGVLTDLIELHDSLADLQAQDQLVGEERRESHYQQHSKKVNASVSRCGRRCAR